MATGRTKGVLILRPYLKMEFIPFWQKGDTELEGRQSTDLTQPTMGCKRNVMCLYAAERAAPYSYAGIALKTPAWLPACYTDFVHKCILTW